MILKKTEKFEFFQNFEGMAKVEISAKTAFFLLSPNAFESRETFYALYEHVHVIG